MFAQPFQLDYNESPSANVMCLPRFWFYSHPQIGNYLSCSNFQEASAKVYLHMTMDPNLIMKFIKFTIQMIEEHIEDFLAYLDINRSMFFSSEDIVES